MFFLSRADKALGSTGESTSQLRVDLVLVQAMVVDQVMGRAMGLDMAKGDMVCHEHEVTFSFR